MFSESHNDRRRCIGDRAAANPDRLRDRDNAVGIGNNSAEIGDGTAGIVGISANVLAMLNSILNGDWSNSVPGRKIPEGPIGRQDPALVPVWKLSSRNRVTPVSIHDPCGVIAEFCGVIADFCGVIADPCGPAELPRSLRRSSGARGHRCGDADRCATH